MKKLFLTLLTVVHFSADAASSTQHHYNDILLRQEDLHRSYRSIYERLTDINNFESLTSWYRLFTKDKSNTRYYQATNTIMQSKILGKSYRQLLYYYALTGQRQQAAQTLGLYLISAHTLIDNTILDPQAQAWNPNAIADLSKKHWPYALARKQIKGIEQCFALSLQRSGVTTRSFDIKRSFAVVQAFKDCVNPDPLVNQLNEKLQTLFMEHKYHGAPFPVSFSGFVGGNKVTLHNLLPDKPRAILDLGDQLHLMLSAQAPGLEKKYKDLTIEDFKLLMDTPEAALTELFTTAEGFRNTHESKNMSHFSDSVLGPIGGDILGTYATMLQAIREAEESVFVDIFWMGGSIGMNLAKELFKKVIEDPDFTVIVITDNENKFQYGHQLDMVYRYMRAFAEKFSNKNFYITPTQINLKRTALPEFADLLITKNVVEDLSANNNVKTLLESDGFHLLAKSDHSKVLIVDGKQPTGGRAFVGSKNWTDSSGGVNRDQVAEVQGPATAIILDSFYYDVYEAFVLDTDPLLGGEMVKNHISRKFGDDAPTIASIKKLLTPIDVLNRTTGAVLIDYEPIGDSVIAMAQNNIYGTEMSAIEQNIQLILGAKHQILIDDQFLYDPQIIDALKFAKEQNKVDIYVLVESLLGYPKDESGSYLFDASGVLRYQPEMGVQVPNNLFVPELASLGIPTKAYHRPDHVVAAISEDQRRHQQSHPLLGATFHLKSLSVDGVMRADSDTCNDITGAIFSEKDNSAPAAVSGSANKDIMTMSGGFRESQITTYDFSSVADHDCLFWQRWDHHSMASTGLEFELPKQADQMGITDKQTFLNTIRQIVFSTYNFTKEHF